MRDRARHLDRVVGFRRRDVGLLDLHEARVLQRRRRVALLDLHVLVVIRLRLRRLFDGRFHREQRFLRRVADFHQRRGVACLLDGLGNHERDVLAGVMHAIIAQRKTFLVPDAAAAAALFLLRRFFELRHVQVRQHRQHAGHRLRRLRVDRENFSFRDVALDCPAVRALRHLELDRVLRRAGDFKSPVHAASCWSYRGRAHVLRLGSASVSLVGFGVSPKQSFRKSSQQRDAVASARDARAPQSKEFPLMSSYPPR